MNEIDMRWEVKFEPNDCQLMSRSKVDAKDKEIAELKAVIKDLEDDITYWIGAYQEEIHKKGRSNE